MKVKKRLEAERDQHNIYIKRRSKKIKRRYKKEKEKRTKTFETRIFYGKTEDISF